MNRRNRFERRRARNLRAAYVMHSMFLIVFAAMLFFAYQADKARGMSADQSLRSAGL